MTKFSVSNNYTLCPETLDFTRFVNQVTGHVINSERFYSVPGPWLAVIGWRTCNTSSFAGLSTEEYPRGLSHDPSSGSQTWWSLEVLDATRGVLKFELGKDVRHEVSGDATQLLAEI